MRYKLSELFDLQMGKTPSRNNSSYWDGGTNGWISIADLTSSGKYIESTKEKLTDKAIQESGIKIIPAGTVVMSFKLSIGKVAITSKPMYSNEAIMAFHDKHVVQLLPDYVYYLFRQKDWTIGTNAAVMGKTLNKATLSEMTMDVVPFEQQKHIVKVLDKVSDILDGRKQEIEYCDTLIKSRFVEMFGTESKHVKMSVICSIITDGTHQPPKFVSNGIPFIFVSNITGNEVTYDAEKFIDDETYEELIQRTPIEIGDIILSTVGSYGHPAVVKSSRKFLFQRHIAYLKPKHDLIDSEYLHSAILSDDVQRQINESVKGIAQKTLNLSAIKELNIPLPDMRDQKDFVDFKEQVDKSKLAIQKSLDETQLLFDSLMQEYFG